MFKIYYSKAKENQEKISKTLNFHEENKDEMKELDERLLNEIRPCFFYDKKESLSLLTLTHQDNHDNTYVLKFLPISHFDGSYDLKVEFFDFLTHDNNAEVFYPNIKEPGEVIQNMIMHYVTNSRSEFFRYWSLNKTNGVSRTRK